MGGSGTPGHRGGGGEAHCPSERARSPWIPPGIALWPSRRLSHLSPPLGAARRLGGRASSEVGGGGAGWEAASGSARKDGRKAVEVISGISVVRVTLKIGVEGVDGGGGGRDWGGGARRVYL
eukprot:scaffold3348_cov113-Isochrysis_galbana.AAC.14